METMESKAGFLFVANLVCYIPFGLQRSKRPSFQRVDPWKKLGFQAFRRRDGGQSDDVCVCVCVSKCVCFLFHSGFGVDGLVEKRSWPYFSMTIG